MAVRCKRIVKTYSSGLRHKVTALNSVDFRVDKAEIVALMGPSGSGKSTLLHIIGLLERPDKGSMWLQNTFINNAPSSMLPKLRNELIGFVFQRHYVLPALTALENVMLPFRYRKTSRREARKRAYSMLDEVGLKHRAEHTPAQLSGGEQQRVAIARALVTQPLLVLADEPTGELDQKTSATIMSLLRHMNQTYGQTIVIATHDRFVAHHCDRIVTIRDGHIVDEINVEQ